VLTRVFAAAAVLVVISVVVFTAAVPLFPTGGINTTSVVQHLELLPLHIVAVGTPVSKRVVDWVVDWVVDGVAGGVSLLSIPLVHLGIPACQTALVLKLIVFKRQTSAGFRSSSTSRERERERERENVSGEARGLEADAKDWKAAGLVGEGWQWKQMYTLGKRQFWLKRGGSDGRTCSWQRVLCKHDSRSCSVRSWRPCSSRK
jgi:hypothetical protein